MPVAIVQQMPEGFTSETYDAVQEKAGISSNPPSGLIFHTLGSADGKWVIVDVWDSEDQFNEFREGTLNPALESVVGSEMFNAMPTPERDFYETHSVVKP
jgi:hypothetical protein